MYISTNSCSTADKELKCCPFLEFGEVGKDYLYIADFPITFLYIPIKIYMVYKSRVKSYFSTPE